MIVAEACERAPALPVTIALTILTAFACVLIAMVIVFLWGLMR